MDTSELVKVACIKIRIGEREFDLSPEEARKLRDVLNDVLGPRAAEPIYIPVPTIPYPYEPVWVNPNVEPWPEKWHITCGPLNQTATLCINAQ